ncbi:transmembrane protein 223 [Carcharodon carcharias]|uniref:transmembrane protein 223 n=1 Tax=Carcharodon carcharias TaxID=13397 RepID=UPI001B7EC90D|nr:transmembrane protein 223 [Carcharodon carcharias]
MGANHLGMGASNLGMGANHLGMGANHLGMGASNLGMGANHLGMVASNLGMGANHLRMGASNLGTGAMRLGANHLGMGASNLGTGGNNLGTGANNLGTGGNNLGTGANNLGTGGNNLRVGPYKLVIGARSLGTRRLASGAGSVVVGTSILPTTSWLLAHGGAVTAICPAIGQLGQRGLDLRRTTHSVAGQRALGGLISPRGLLGWGGTLCWLGQCRPAWSVTTWGVVASSRLLCVQVPQDVLLFRHERATFFRLLGLFCVAQFLFWSYLAHFAFTSLKDTGYQETVLVGEQASSLPKIGGLTLNLGSDKWRYGFTTSCLTVGSLILAAGYLFARRSVCRVLLCRGGQEVTVSSYLPFGSTSSFTVPLRQVCCVAHRSQVSSLIPLKIGGRPFYYLLDKQGQFYNAKLFDMTIGAYRKL